MLERKLLQYGMVTMDQLGEAMREEAATGRPVDGILIERGWVTQEQIAQLFEPAAPPLALAPEPVALTSEPVALAPEPQPEPAVVAEVPPEPTPEPVPTFAPPSPPAPEPVAEVPPVAPGPAPAAQEPASVDPEPETDYRRSGPSSLAFHLYIRLSTGERIDANTFSDLNEAREHAEDLVKKLASNSHVWPHFGGRYIRPDAIISIDVEAAPV
jgi:outer membrane biosynthesis protein TonB